MKSMIRTVFLAALLSMAGTLAAVGDEPARICGGIVPTACPADQYCDFAGGACGATDQTGFCMPKPEACTREYLPVCGCDGKTYGNDCERRAAGVSKQKDGAC